MRAQWKLGGDLGHLFLHLILPGEVWLGGNVEGMLLDGERGAVKLGAILVVATNVAHAEGVVLDTLVVLVQDADLLVHAHRRLAYLSAPHIFVAAHLRAGVASGTIFDTKFGTNFGGQADELAVGGGVKCVSCANGSEGKGDKKGE